MNREEQDIIAEAAAWHAASNRDDMDWDGFTLWLEADPRHRSAYDEVALSDALLDEHRDAVRPASPAANDDEEDAAVAAVPSVRRGGRWKLWSGLAVAASLAGLLVLPMFRADEAMIYQTRSASRSIALDDGSTIMLAPHSRLEVGGGQREVALNGGAWFDIRHDPDRALTITVGGARISDIGTRFDVQDAAGRLRVAVAEGTVRVSADALARPVDLAAGRGLTLDPQSGTALIGAVAAEDAGAWRSGRLSYDSVPLTLVAADIARYSGVKVAVAPLLRDRRFSGTLIVGNGETALRDLSQLMGIGLAGGDGAYRLVARSR